MPEIVPPSVLQVTAVLLEFDTVAVMFWLAEVLSDTELGETVTLTGGAGVTVTIVVADLEVSAWLVAVTL